MNRLIYLSVNAYQKSAQAACQKHNSTVWEFDPGAIGLFIYVS